MRVNGCPDLSSFLVRERTGLRLPHESQVCDLVCRIRLGIIVLDSKIEERIDDLDALIESSP